MFYLCYLYLFTNAVVQYDFHIRSCLCHLIVTRRVTLGKQEVLTFPEVLSSLPVLSEVRVANSLIVCNGLLSIVCLFVLVLLVIALSVHHLHTALFERHAKHYRFSSTIFKSKSRWIRM